MARLNGYEIRRVDNSDKKTQALIKRMQVKVDPTSDPAGWVKGTWWLVYWQGKPVAFGGVYPATKTPGAAYLCRSGVYKRHRGNGLQRELLRLRVLWARANGFNAVVTETITGNIYSCNNLIRAGFLMYQPAVRWNKNDAYAIYWRKKL